jgi:hypothetical protein
LHIHKSLSRDCTLREIIRDIAAIPAPIMSDDEHAAGPRAQASGRLTLTLGFAVIVFLIDLKTNRTAHPIGHSR